MNSNNISDSLTMAKLEYNSIQISPMRSEHSQQVAILHKIGLPNGFLSQFSDRFLSELYQAIASAPRSGVWVAIDNNDNCHGFISGSCHINSCYLSIIKNKFFPLTFYGIKTICRKSSLRKACDTILYPFFNSSKPNSKSSLMPLGDTPAELLSISVSPQSRGSGLGRHLVQTMELAFCKWEFQGHYRVVTDASDSHSNEFYRKLGFKYTKNIIHHGQHMSLYTKVVSSTDSQG